MEPQTPTQNEQITPVQPPSQASPNTSMKDPGKTLGIVGLVLGILGFALIGLILSIVGNNRSKKAGFKNTVAVIGIWLNSIFLILGTLFVFMIFASVPALQQNAEENRQRSEQLRIESEKKFKDSEN